VCELYDVWALKKFMGREYMGVLRTTFLIDARGKLCACLKTSNLQITASNCWLN
jgi:thioredoxin-dependent peroxiredoxin